MAKKTKELEDEPKTTKKARTKKVVATKKTAATTKNAASKKSTTAKKSTSTRVTKSRATKKAVSKFQTEYYDLPYSYNKTVVKILAQTPKTLFVYWEIAEEDRKKFKKTYGEKFFEETKPVLIVYNTTMNYSFEVDINDFANSWYIHIEDSKCNYAVELGRKPLPIANTHLSQEQNSEEAPRYIPYYVYVSSSNRMDAPNNHVLYDFTKNFVIFRNVKTGQITNKDINHFKFVTNLGIMTIAELYKQLYPNETFEYENFVGNPSSGLSSSGTFSSMSYK